MTTYHDHTFGYDVEVDDGSDFVDEGRFPGFDTLPWAPTPATTTGKAMVGVFFRTYGMVIVGTALCAMLVFPPLFPLMFVGGVVVGLAVGLVMAVLNTLVTGWTGYPPRSLADYRTMVRTQLYGLVLVTIGIGCGSLVAALLRDVLRGTQEPFEQDLLQFVGAVAYAAYAILGCLAIARWTGRVLADQVIRVQWPELDVPIPTRRQLRRQHDRGGVPWG